LEFWNSNIKTWRSVSSLLSFPLCVDAWRLFAPEPPVWPTSYTAKGIINLPYAEIGEPFDAWYDGPNQRSRIDYYSGMLN
jgi:hypothetical protein